MTRLRETVQEDEGRHVTLAFPGTHPVGTARGCQGGRVPRTEPIGEGTLPPSDLAPMTAYKPEDVQAAFAAVVVDEWARAGVTDAVVCPGSRSTPLLIALAEAAEQGVFRLHSVLDERSAGFYALGLGMASGLPAPVVTTSGTAAVELHPAVVEAHHSGVPLLAVTADRPAELQDCGAPQTVHQVGLYGQAARWQAQPGVPELVAARSWRSMASRSVSEALGGARRRARCTSTSPFVSRWSGRPPTNCYTSSPAGPSGRPGTAVGPCLRCGRPVRSSSSWPGWGRGA